MAQDMIEPISVGLKQALREALRTCKGYRVLGTLGARRATLAIHTPDNTEIQIMQITGQEVTAQWHSIKACPTSVLGSPGFLQTTYEYADPGFIARLRRDTRETARMHRGC